MEKTILIYRLEVLAIFLAKGRVLVITGETREEGNLLEREYLLLENMEHRKEEFPGHHPLLLAVEPYPGQDIYSLLQISLSWTELEVLYPQKKEIF